MLMLCIKRLTIFSIFLILLLGMGCSLEKDISEVSTRNTKGDIVIAAVAPWKELKGKFDLWNGIELAVQEINQAGGILKRKLRVIKRDDQADLKMAKNIAMELSENMDVVAVIGHWNSNITSRVAVLFEYYKLLFISSSYEVVDKLQPSQGKYLFNIFPALDDIALKTIKVLKDNGLSRLIIYSRQGDLYQERIANDIERLAYDQGITIVDRRSYADESGPYFYAKDFESWKKFYTFDAFFIPEYTDRLLMIHEQAEKVGITCPVVCGFGLYARWFMDRVNGLSRPIYFSSIYDASVARPSVARFNKDYLAAYHVPPDDWAVQGYNLVQVLATAIARAKSTDPDKMSEALDGLKIEKSVDATPMLFNQIHRFPYPKLIMHKAVDGQIRKEP